MQDYLFFEFMFSSKASYRSKDTVFSCHFFLSGIEQKRMEAENGIKLNIDRYFENNIINLFFLFPFFAFIYDGFYVIIDV